VKSSNILRIGAAAALLAAIAAGVAFLPLRQYLLWLLEHIEHLGAWGPVLLVGVYVVICTLMLPSWFITLAAGFLFGMVWGATTACVGSVLGAMAAFFVARSVARPWVEHRLAGHPYFLALDRAIATQGLKIVALVRLCSLSPYALTSYLFGLTKVPLGPFLFGSWLGRLPATIIYAYIGSTAKSLVDVAMGRVDLGRETGVLFGLGLLAMVAVVVVISHTARQSLREVFDDSSALNGNEESGSRRAPDSRADS
jgi:uncharacterized membrane protein YdjX (TVP38/TMEM64 family)